MLKKLRSIKNESTTKTDEALNELYPKEIMEIICEAEEQPNSKSYSLKQAINMVIMAYELGYKKASKKIANS